ncbi:hypothetical protein DH2020_021565 [Rehmannia glutinosa]|uniref:DDE Tnp4 domain-containing protein n=1 Tax=Rehmannia glutinosa TaxID=99300 RepID=A0ABR0WF17_REHGL
MANLFGSGGVDNMDEEVIDEAANDVFNDGNVDIVRLRDLLHRQYQSFCFLQDIFPRSFSNLSRQPFNTSSLRGSDWLNEILLGHPRRFYNQLHMDKDTFHLLCTKVRDTGRVPEHQRTRVSLQESVAIFLYTVGRHQRHRLSMERFQRSGETISRHVHVVCDALCDMAQEYICPPDMSVDCVGAIDGTIVEAWAPARNHATYRTRKGLLGQNVMAACDFNLMFTFVMAGWEGSANDARVFADAISNPQYNFPWPPSGKYYVVDSGYTNFPGSWLLTGGPLSYSPEWMEQIDTQEHVSELYNRRHAIVSNHIERCFGGLKKRFPMLKGLMPNYLLCTQSDIVIACCVIHNFIRKHCNVPDEIWNAIRDPDWHEPDENEQASTSRPIRRYDLSEDALWEQNLVRDSIAQHLWHDHCRGGAH